MVTVDEVGDEENEDDEGEEDEKLAGVVSPKYTPNTATTTKAAATEAAMFRGRIPLSYRSASFILTAYSQDLDICIEVQMQRILIAL